MALGALKQTPSADYSGAITGYFGPDSPADEDGVCYLSIAGRRGAELDILKQQRIELPIRSRYERQQLAAGFLLDLIYQTIRVQVGR
jgi:nicotinamide mononucleotide (NMN) deamidase PncC